MSTFFQRRLIELSGEERADVDQAQTGLWSDHVVVCAHISRPCHERSGSKSGTSRACQARGAGVRDSVVATNRHRITTRPSALARAGRSPPAACRRSPYGCGTATGSEAAGRERCGGSEADDLSRVLAGPWLGKSPTARQARVAALFRIAHDQMRCRAREGFDLDPSRGGMAVARYVASATMLRQLPGRANTVSWPPSDV